MKDGDVAKTTKDGITCMEFHPQCSGLVVAACDKSGKVRLLHELKGSIHAAG